MLLGTENLFFLAPEGMHTLRATCSRMLHVPFNNCNLSFHASYLKRLESLKTNLPSQRTNQL